MRVVVENLSRSFGSSKVLRDLDLTLEPGITGILGPNGAGKTTLLRILSTALAPSKGSIKVGGWDLSTPHGRTGARRRLGYLPQEVGYYPRFTVFQLVDYIAVLKELDDRAERHRRVRAAIDAVRLSEVAGKRIKTLSGGMRRRVGIAQAIVADPELLLLDEPTGGLDPEQRMRFRQLVTSLAADRTVVLSTHLVEDIAAVCTNVVVLWQGQVLFQGQPAKLREQADGMVWLADVVPDSALLSWRTEEGVLRVIGPRPSAAAVAIEPTLEDAYLLVTNCAPTDTQLR
ncbi:MAG: ABC transporter ATP-binding protein [Acidimicrobiales bacterium]|jgi:ABC-2 type transport system ATP-binding protein